MYSAQNEKIFREQYQQYNEQIQPEARLVQSVIKRAEKIEGRRRGKSAVFRKTAIVIASACICLYVAAPALAASSESAYQIMYLVSPAMAQHFMPVQKSDVDNGIRMEVVSAYIQDHKAQIYITMQDLEEDRIDASIDLFDSYRINSPFDCTCHCECIGYEESMKTAAFLITIEQWDGRDISGDKITFSVRTFLSAKKEYENIYVPVELFGISDARQMQRVWTNGGGYKDEKWRDAIDEPMALVPAAPMQEFPVEGMELTGIGYVDGKLHIQTRVENPLEKDNHGFFYLKDRNGEEMTCIYSFSFFNTEQGEQAAYHEQVFDISREELAECGLYGNFVTTGRKTDGKWRVTFPLEKEK